MQETTVPVKKNPQKSLARAYLIGELLADYLTPIDYRDGGELLFVDFPIVIRSIYDTSVITLVELFRRFHAYFEKLLQNPRFKGVILLNDIQKYVTRMKDAEQLKRNEAANVGIYVEGIDYPFEKDFNFETVLHHPYQKLLGDRYGFRQSFLKWLSWNLLCGPYRVVGPTGKFWGIYGHALTKKDFEWRELTGSLDCTSFLNFIDPDNVFIENHLLVITSDGKSSDKLSAPYWQIHGEADIQGFNLALQIVKDSQGFIKTVEFLSTDTDFMYLCLVFFERHRNEIENVYYSYCDSATSWVNWCKDLGAPIYFSTSKVLKKNKAEYEVLQRVSSKQLLNLLDEKVFRKRVLFPAETLMIAALLSGSDCTDAYPKIYHEKVFKALFKYLDHVDTLYMGNNKIDPAAYRRLLMAAWGFPKDEKQQPLSNMTIDLRIKHAQAYFTLLLQMDTNHSVDPDLLEYGYRYDENSSLYLRLQ